MNAKVLFVSYSFVLHFGGGSASRAGLPVLQARARGKKIAPHGGEGGHFWIHPPAHPLMPVLGPLHSHHHGDSKGGGLPHKQAKTTLMIQ